MIDRNQITNSNQYLNREASSKKQTRLKENWKSIHLFTRSIETISGVMQSTHEITKVMETTPAPSASRVDSYVTRWEGSSKVAAKGGKEPLPFERSVKGCQLIITRSRFNWRLGKANCQFVVERSRSIVFIRLREISINLCYQLITSTRVPLN